MPGRTLPPNLGKQLNRSVQRVERLERTTVPPGPNAVTSPVVFSYPGSLTNNTESPPWYASRTHRFTKARISLLSASTSALTVKINIDGLTAYTLTLAAGLTSTTWPIGLNAFDGDYVTVKVTAVGTASNATVQLS